MKTHSLLLLVSLLIPSALLARDLHLTNGLVLREIAVRLVENDSLSVIHSTGTMKVEFSKLCRADYYDLKVDQQSTLERNNSSLAGGRFHDQGAGPWKKSDSSQQPSDLASRDYSTRSYLGDRYSSGSSSSSEGSLGLASKTNSSGGLSAYEQNFKPVYVPPSSSTTSLVRSYSNRDYSGDRYIPRTDNAPKTQHVRGYVNKNGTYVAPYTRRSPRSR